MRKPSCRPVTACDALECERPKRLRRSALLVAISDSAEQVLCWLERSVERRLSGVWILRRGERSQRIRTSPGS